MKEISKLESTSKRKVITSIGSEFSGYTSILLDGGKSNVIKTIAAHISPGEYLCLLSRYFHCCRFFAFFIWIFFWRTENHLEMLCACQKNEVQNINEKVKEFPSGENEQESENGEQKNLLEQMAMNVGNAIVSLLNGNSLSPQQMKEKSENFEWKLDNGFPISKETLVEICRCLCTLDGRRAAITPQLTAIIADNCLDNNGKFDVNKGKCFKEILKQFHFFSEVVHVLEVLMGKPYLLENIGEEGHTNSKVLEVLQADWNVGWSGTPTPREIRRAVLANALMPILQNEDGNCGVVAVLYILQSGDVERMFFDFGKLVAHGNLPMYGDDLTVKEVGFKLKQHKKVNNSHYSTINAVCLLQRMWECTAAAVMKQYCKENETKLRERQANQNEEVFKRVSWGYGINSNYYSPILLSFLGGSYSITEKKLVNPKDLKTVELEDLETILENQKLNHNNLMCPVKNVAGTQEKNIVGHIFFEKCGSSAHFETAALDVFPKLSQRDTFKNKEQMVAISKEIFEKPLQEIFPDRTELEEFFFNVAYSIPWITGMLGQREEETIQKFQFALLGIYDQDKTMTINTLLSKLEQSNECENFPVNLRALNTMNTKSPCSTIYSIKVHIGIIRNQMLLKLIQHCRIPMRIVARRNFSLDGYFGGMSLDFAPTYYGLFYNSDGEESAVVFSSSCAQIETYPAYQYPQFQIIYSIERLPLL
jgi:hypothetical protein